MRSVYTMSPIQMLEWKEICQAYADKVGAELIFVNETSFGIQYPDGMLSHIYIDELADILTIRKLLRGEEEI